MDIGEPFNGSDANTFNQQTDNLCGFIEWDSKAVQRPLWNIPERLAALFTAVTLNPFPAEIPEFVALNLAIMTRHLTFPGQDLNFACILKDTQL